MSLQDREARRAALHAAWVRARVPQRRVGFLKALLEECAPIIGQALKTAGRSHDADARQQLVTVVLSELPKWKPEKANLSSFLSARLRGALADLGRTALRISTCPLDEERDGAEPEERESPVFDAARSDDFVNELLADVPTVRPAAARVAAATPIESNDYLTHDRLAELIGEELALAYELYADRDPDLTQDDRRTRFAAARDLACVSLAGWKRIVAKARKAVDDLTPAERDCLRAATRVDEEDGSPARVWTFGDHVETPYVPTDPEEIAERWPVRDAQTPRPPALSADDVTYLVEKARSAPLVSANRAAGTASGYRAMRPAVRPNSYAAYRQVQTALRFAGKRR